MAWTGFGGSWSNGVHNGGDDGGGSGGGLRAPSAADIASQFNSYGGTQISASQVSNIQSDGDGGYTANIQGQTSTVSSGNGNHTSNKVGGFSGVPNNSSSAGGGNGNGGGNPSSSNSSNGANMAWGGAVEIDLGNGMIATIIGTHPLNPGICGVPWADEKDAKSVKEGNKYKSAKFKADVKKWKVGNYKNGSLASPSIYVGNSFKDETHYMVNFGTEKYLVIHKHKNDILSYIYSDGTVGSRIGEMGDQALAVAKLYLVNEKQKDLLTQASEIISDAGEKLSKKLNAQYNKIAKEIATNIKNFDGKKVRSYKDAVASLTKIQANPNMKLSQADKKALSNALKSMDKAVLASQFKGLGVAFSVADKALKAAKVIKYTDEGLTTGNWKPLALELEAMILSGVAASVALGIVTSILASAAVQMIAIPAVAITALTFIAIIAIAFAASFIDAKKVDEINTSIAGFFKK